MLWRCFWPYTRGQRWLPLPLWWGASAMLTGSHQVLVPRAPCAFPSPVHSSWRQNGKCLQLLVALGVFILFYPSSLEECCVYIQQSIAHVFSFHPCSEQGQWGEGVRVYAVSLGAGELSSAAEQALPSQWPGLPLQWSLGWSDGLGMDSHSASAVLSTSHLVVSTVPIPLLSALLSADTAEALSPVSTWYSRFLYSENGSTGLWLYYLKCSWLYEISQKHLNPSDCQHQNLHERRKSRGFTDSSETNGSWVNIQRLLKYFELFEGNSIPYCLGHLIDSDSGGFSLYSGL